MFNGRILMRKGAKNDEELYHNCWFEQVEV